MHSTSTQAEIEEARAQHHAIVGEVYRETNQQLRRWNVQNHPRGTGLYQYAAAAERARRECDRAAQRGALTWTHILREEFLEAIAEEDPESMEKELIQVAAVAVSMVAASRRARGA